MIASKFSMYLAHPCIEQDYDAEDPLEVCELCRKDIEKEDKMAHVEDVVMHETCMMKYQKELNEQSRAK